MEIHLTSGIGFGSTPLSAFDAALREAGIHNFNLLKLSSVIPTGAKVKIVPCYSPDPAEHGYLLYLVLAETRAGSPGTSLAAGLGWYQLEDGRGVFAEHSEQAEGLTPHDVESSVSASLRNTIRDLCSHREWPFDGQRLRLHVTSHQVDERPTSVLVAAVYESRPFVALGAGQ